MGSVLLVASNPLARAALPPRGAAGALHTRKSRRCAAMRLASNTPPIHFGQGARRGKRALAAASSHSAARVVRSATKA